MSPPKKFLDEINSLRPLIRGKDDIDLTSGQITENLFYLSFPIIIINLLRTAYNFADTFWLGQYSKEALAAISLSYPLVFLLISLSLGISIAGSVLVAQYTGRNKKDKAEKAASQTLVYGISSALILGILAFVNIEVLLKLLGANSTVLRLSVDYMQIVSLGLFSIFGFSVFISLMRGYGDTLTPMMVMFGTVVLNVILDPVLIFGWSIFPEMGIKGAAVATIFSRSLAMLIGFYILWKGSRGVSVSMGKMKPDIEYAKKIVQLGTPASIETTGRAISVNLLVAIVGGFSATVIAGYGIGIRIFSLVFLPATGIGRGVETMAGQNLGAKKMERADKVAIISSKISMALLTILGIVVFIFPVQIASIFTKNQSVAQIGGNFLRVIALSFGFVGVQRSITGAFRGAGQTVLAAIIGVSMLGFVRLPLAWFLSADYGPAGIWAAFPVSNIFGGLVALAVFYLYNWKQSVD